MMRMAIQRRSIYLCPPEGMDLVWVSRHLENPEVTHAFSLDTPVPGWQFRQLVKLGSIIVGIIRRADSGQRVGWACMFAPDPEDDRDWWEIAAAIEKTRHRDAFTMLHAVDVMSHYMFDHLGAEKCGARVRNDNPASAAVAKRLGHRRREEQADNGEAYGVYLLDKQDWARRRAKLDAGEVSRPSGTGGTFVVLPGPPWEPVRPPTTPGSDEG